MCPPLTTASTEKPQHRIGAEALGVVLGTVGEVEKLAFRIYGSPQNNDALVDFDEKGVMYRTGTSGYYSIDAEKPKIAVCLLDRKIDDRLKEKMGIFYEWSFIVQR